MKRDGWELIELICWHDGNRDSLIIKNILHKIINVMFVENFDLTSVLLLVCRIICCQTTLTGTVQLFCTCPTAERAVRFDLSILDALSYFDVIGCFFSFLLDNL